MTAARLTRRSLLAGLGAATLATPALASAALRGPYGLDWLETASAAAGAPAPSSLHSAFSHALYVNVAGRGDGAQRLWMLSRAEGADWGLGLTDRAGDGADGASWLISSGRKYAGERSGPTPPGVFNLDERPHRHRPGWGSPGMYNALYIDLHYSSGRASGVALHGTPRSKYRRLGTIDSHGCVRMTQENADQLWAVIHPGGARGPASPIWGDVPRFFRTTPRQDWTARRGYVRDGSLLQDASTGALLTKPGYRMLAVFFHPAA
ncbi:MAG: L,D-transpeptidase [Pseudomonadota bacterium]